jgi:hypothetical protein
MLDGLIWDYMRRTISTPARASRKLGDDRQQPELFAIERAVSPYAGAQHPIMS